METRKYFCGTSHDCTLWFRVMQFQGKGRVLKTCVKDGYKMNFVPPSVQFHISEERSIDNTKDMQLSPLLSNGPCNAHTLTMLELTLLIQCHGYEGASKFFHNPACISY